MPESDIAPGISEARETPLVNVVGPEPDPPTIVTVARCRLLSRNQRTPRILLRDDLRQDTARVGERGVRAAVGASACRRHQGGEELSVGCARAVHVLPLLQIPACATGNDDWQVVR